MIVTPDTVLRWFRVLIAKNWTYAKTQENRTWGSNRICGAFSNLGYQLSDSTIDNVRRRIGLDHAEHQAEFGVLAWEAPFGRNKCHGDVKTNSDTDRVAGRGLER